MTISKWNIDSTHSGVHFVARHMVITKVRGSFKAFEGTLELDEADLTRSKIHVKIDAGSIDTAEARRDAHLKSPDFLDVEKFPALVFESKSLKKSGDDYLITGDLSLHGVTKEVTLKAEVGGQGKDPWGNQRTAFSATTSINREDFGLKWNQVLEAGGVLVGTKIDIELDVQAVLDTKATVAA
jgi:polyisoprenoid-binding protein YceI